MRETRSAALSGVGQSRNEPPAANVIRTDAFGDRPVDRDSNIIPLVSILRRRRKGILAVVAVGGMLAGAVGLLIPPRYTATAQLIVEPQQADFVDGMATVTRAADESTIDTQVTMLSSRAHLRRVLESLSRKPDSQAMPGARSYAAPSDLLVDGVARPVGDGDSATPAAPYATSAESLSLDELFHRLKVWFWAPFAGRDATARELDELERQLRVMQERRSRVISVSFTSTSPERAAAIANRVVGLHIAYRTAERRNKASEELIRIAKRSAELKAESERTGEAVQRILEQRLTAGLGGGNGETGLRDLERAAAAEGQSYASLLKREIEIRDQQESIPPDASILALATPPDRPSSPNPILFVFPALIASTICGCLLAVVRERFDRGLRSERDVGEALGIPCIGLVPQLRRSDLARLDHCLVSKPYTPYTEAIRSAAATLQLASVQRPPIAVLISSSVPGEGKTTMATSLAVYLGHLGKRVLLIDFDSRHPSALRRKHASPPVSISDLRNRPPAEFVHHLADVNVDYLAMPCLSNDPLALLSDRHMQDFMRQLRVGYDCVLMDSPPLLGITEARLLAAFADKCLFLVKWGATRQEVAQNALNLLNNPVRSEKERALQISALLTQVNWKEQAEYRRGDVAEAFTKYRKYYFQRSVRT